MKEYKYLFFISKKLLKTAGMSVLAKLILQRLIQIQYGQEEDYPICSLEYLVSFFGERENRVMNALTELLQHDFLTDYIGFKKTSNGNMIYKWGLNYEKLKSLYGYSLPHAHARDPRDP